MTVAELDVIINARIDKLEAEIGKAQIAINGFTREAGESVRKMASDMASQATAIGRGMTMGITLPLVGIAVAATKLSADFGDAMAKVEGAAGASHEEVVRLKGAVLSLAGATGKAPKELAEGLYYVESMGYRGARAMEVMNQSARLSASGFGSTADIAKVTAFAVNAYGEKNLSAARAADIFAAAVREGAMPADALAGAIGRVLPEASRMGVGLDTLTGSLSAMTRIGLNVDEAVTAMRATFLAMDKPSKQTREALDSVGLSADAVAKGMKTDLIGTLGVLAQASKKGGDEFARIFPNVRAFTGVLALTGTRSKETAALIDRVKHSAGAADHAFEVASHTAGFQFRQALSYVQTAAISLGDTLAPVMTQIASAVKTAADGFAKLSPTVKQVIVDVLAVVAAIGPLLMIAGSLTQSVLSVITLFESLGPLLSTVSAAFAGAGGAAGVLGTVLEALTGPVGWVIAAAGLLYTAWVKDWGGIREYVAGVVRQIVAWWQKELPKIQEVAAEVVSWVMAIWSKMQPYFTMLWNNLVDSHSVICG